MRQDSLKLILAALALIVLSFGCTPSPDQLKKILSENPEIVLDVIEKHPVKFAETFRKAHREAQKKSRAKAEGDEKTRRESEYKNPKKPEIEKGRAVLGSFKAPITVVEYSDFQCPYCKRGYETVAEVKKKYGKKVRVIFKHLPLDFHPMAMPAAERFEAIAIQNGKKAYKFHDLVFQNQSQLRSGGEKFLDSMAKKAGANVAKMKKDMKSDKVKKIIQKDMAEARKFGISGTPGFIVEGITLKGAYPITSFSEIIDRRIKEKGL